MEKSPPYQLFMFGLCLYALATLTIGAAIPLDRETQRIFDYADLGVCLLFFTDFLVSLVRASGRWKYLYTWGWLDLLSVMGIGIQQPPRAA